MADQQGQIVRVHGPYEDAIIAACSLAEKIVDGQDADTRKHIWTRHLELTGPLHDLAMTAMTNFEKFFLPK